MMLLNSVAVVAIGALMLPVLRPHAPSTAVGYLATRIFEGSFLAIGAIALLVGAANTNFLAYNIAMAGLGIGSLFFCVALYRLRLVPRILAVWGFVGYAAFATGCFLELAGVAGAGLVSTIPGGLFEILFSIWLIVRGFGAPAAITAITTINSIPSLASTTVIVTGANSGIGLEAARVFAAWGAHVVFAVRDEKKGRDAAATVTGSTEVRPLDLADLGLVREFVEEWTGDIYLLINNAGVLVPPFGHTKDGFELQFGINHLRHFALG